MARLVPDDIAELDQGPWHPSERATLDKLAVALSGEFTVYHGIHWARADVGGSVYGEIDFIIANRQGRLLAIEQKDVPVMVVRNDLVVHYRHERAPKSLITQVSRNLNALRNEFGRKHQGRGLSIDHLLYLPESVIEGQLPAGVDPERVIDRTTAHELIARIEALFDASPTPTGETPADPLEVHEYLAQVVRAAPHIGLLGERAKTFSSRLSSGLTTWAQRLEMSPYRLHVKGTAGSGKTQLALEELKRAQAAGLRSLYVCYNRALADAMRQSAPRESKVVTFHEMGREFMEALGEPLNFQDPGIYGRMAEVAVNYAPQLQGSFGCIVVDEAQDFERAWVDALIQMATPVTRMLVLEDANQRLYEREPLALPDWVVMKSPVNYRSPKAVVDLINEMQLTDEPIEWGGAVIGESPEVFEYGEEGPLEATAQALASLIEQGFRPEQIVVLSLRGASSSELFLASPETQYAGYRLRRHVGYEDGEVKYSEGEILLETVHRFKGQAADAMVLVGVPQSVDSEMERNRVFVGMTRGRLQVSILNSFLPVASVLPCNE